MANPLHDRLFAPHADREAPFLHLADGAVLSHAAFGARAAGYAHALAAAGLEPGDRLAMQVAKSADALALVAGCIRAGVVVLPLNTGYTAGEVGYFLTDSGARMLVCDSAAAGALDGLAPRLETLDADGTGSLPRRAAEQPDRFDAVPRQPGDLAALLYTSGTTGRSKGAMLSHRNLLSNALTLAELWQFGADDVPIFHTHGLFVASFVTLAAGGAMIFLPKFDADAVIARLPGATAMMGVPTFYTRLLDDPRLTRELVAHMRLFVSGSAPLLPETHRRFAERTGHAILERYGMTETNMNASNPYSGERRPGTVGFPLPGVELRVADPETGAERMRGEVGQVEVRGPNVFGGYWRMPEKTAGEMRADGFFVTGDLGRFDADGYLSIVGREKDLIISGGYNVYPREIEAVLDAQPGVAESAVIGVPHADFGETPVAVIVPEPGAEPDPEAIFAALAGALARYKHPAALRVVDALPRNAMGKVQKAELRARYRDLFA